MKMDFAAVAGGFLWTISYEEQKVISDVEGSVAEKVTDKVTDNQMKILQLIRKKERITTNELAIQLNISQRKIEENLKKLKDTGKLVRVGSSKSGYWKVNRDIE